MSEFEAERHDRVFGYAANAQLASAAADFIHESALAKYSYNFSWMGRPVIQYPQDLVALQEIIWSTKPGMIIETGIAHGGSLIFYASMLELLGSGRVIGIDVDIRPHNRLALEEHPMAKRITLVEGSSTDASLVRNISATAKGAGRVMVVLDSNHTHEHVIRELGCYAPLVSQGCYLVVLDTAIEDVAPELTANRPWGKGNNPKTAVHEFLKSHPEFEIDKSVHDKLQITVAPDGYLKRIR
ncbi:MAG: cephalosporin hydroxylase family protein [Candidatus Parcubacteria bacterium]|nr:cephalosporin hydroxylase family protein [Burkholderiales bacterium]